MRRFYADSIDGGTAVITDTEQLHHLKDVLRLKPGAEIAVLDGRGKEYSGTLTALDKKRALVKIDTEKSASGRKYLLTIACAIPRGSRMDDMIDHLTQLGVARVIPMFTERVVVKLDDSRSGGRVERWKKIARNAARQCRRCDVPAIDPVTPVEKVVTQSKDYDLKMIPTLEGDRKHIKDVLAASRPQNILVLIGPEGDFTPAEVALALKEGFVPVSLGDTVLRVTTAAMAVAGYILFALSDNS
jgi:16S rRNA (uracil1498-N3)-methyltransferase